MYNKKAQVTVFIAIGLIMLISVSTYFYFRAKTTQLELAPELAAIEEAPSEFQEFRIFITNCIRRTATDGVKLLGAQGGYIDLDEVGVTARTDPTEGQAVYFSPGSQLKVPYWFYLKSDNTCTGTCQFSNARPELHRGRRDSIEEQLDNYVNENLDICLEDFAPLKREGYDVKELAKPSTRVTVGNYDVSVYVKYPLEVSIEGLKEGLSEFIAYVPVNLKDMYDLASHISNLEAENKFIENDVLNLLVGFSGKDKNKLPPMTASGIGTNAPIYWQRTKVKSNIEEMLTSYIPLLQVEGTLNFAPKSFPGNALLESIYNQAMLIPNSKPYRLDVSFTYLGWPTYFDLNCNGEVCTSDSVGMDLIPGFGLEKYNFVYDLSFPVLVELRDPTAFGFEGYDFRFMLEANIRNNEPLDIKFEPLEAASLPDNSMLCDINKRNSGKITVEVKDDITGETLDDVFVSYSCADETCMMGLTEDGKLSEDFPVCFGGAITFTKEGYITHSRRLDTELDESNSFNVYLKPILTKEFKVRKKRLVKNPEGWVFMDTAVGLTRNESLFLTLTRINEEGEADFSTVAEYTGGISEIQLASGRYEIDARLSTDAVFIIPAEERCEDVLFGEECFTMDEFVFNESMVNGGVNLEYEFTNEDLSKDTVVFYVLNPFFTGIPMNQRTVEDLEQISKLDEYSDQYQLFLRPTFE